jgi:hypothetical protein
MAPIEQLQSDGGATPRRRERDAVQSARRRKGPRSAGRSQRGRPAQDGAECPGARAPGGAPS